MLFGELQPLEIGSRFQANHLCTCYNYKPWLLGEEAYIAFIYVITEAISVRGIYWQGNFQPYLSSCLKGSGRHSCSRNYSELLLGTLSKATYLLGLTTAAKVQ